jgi:hypothetical protein
MNSKNALDSPKNPFTFYSEKLNTIITKDKVTKQGFFGRIIGFFCGDYSQKETTAIIHNFYISFNKIQNEKAPNQNEKAPNIEDASKQTSKQTSKKTYNDILEKMKQYVKKNKNELDPDFVTLCTGLANEALAAKDPQLEMEEIERKEPEAKKMERQEQPERKEHDGELLEGLSKYRAHVKYFFKQKGVPSKENAQCLHIDTYSSNDKKDGISKEVTLVWGNGFDAAADKGEYHVNNIPGNKDCRGALIGTKMPGGYSQANTEVLGKLENINQKFDLDFEAQAHFKIFASEGLKLTDRLNTKDLSGKVTSFGPPPDARDKIYKGDTDKVQLNKDMTSYLNKSFDTPKIFLIDAALEQQDKKNAALEKLYKEVQEINDSEMEPKEKNAALGNLNEEIAKTEASHEMESKEKKTLVIDTPISGTGIFENKVEDVLKDFKAAMEAADLTLTSKDVLSEMEMIGHKLGYLRATKAELIKQKEEASNDHEKYKEYFKNSESKEKMKNDLIKELEDKIKSLDVADPEDFKKIQEVRDMVVEVNLKTPIDAKSWYVNKYKLYLLQKEKELRIRHNKLIVLLSSTFSDQTTKIKPAKLGFDKLKIQVYIINNPKGEGREVLEAFDAWDAVFHSPSKQASLKQEETPQSEAL